MRLTDIEYASLRHTIALRGTVRIALLPAIVLGWSGLATTLAVTAMPAAGFVLSLLILVAGFEAIYALHAGAERIGRYLQLSYEDAPTAPRWETTAMAVGPALPGGGVDPLFTYVFAAATATNAAAVVVTTPGLGLLILLAFLHGAFGVRILRVRSAAARQRQVELARMSEILKPEVRNPPDDDRRPFPS